MNIILDDFGLAIVITAIIAILLSNVIIVALAALGRSGIKAILTETSPLTEASAFKDPNSVQEDALNLFAENELYELTTPFSRHISVLECVECGTIGSPRMIDINGPCPVCGIYETSFDEAELANQSFAVIVAKPVKNLEQGYAYWERV